MRRFLNRCWYRWKLMRYRMRIDYEAPLWCASRNGWIYPDGYFQPRTDYK